MSKQIDTAAYLHIGYGMLILLIGIIAFVALLGGGLLSGDASALAITSGVGTFVAVLFMLLSIPSFLAGYGLLRRAEWGRVLAFIMSILDLFSFPIGTAVGGYTIWVLMKEEVRAEFA